MHPWNWGKRRRGCINIRAYRDEDKDIIEVEDNGVGMENGIIENIFKEALGNEAMSIKPKKGHTTGIGVNNVILRLRFISNRRYFGYI